MFTVALLEPKIPQNTGNIARLCLATDTKLDLVGKLGFVIHDSKLKRSGLDYWPKLQPSYHPDLAVYIEGLKTKNFALFSTKGQKSFWDYDFPKDAILVFGSEDKGFPADFLNAELAKTYTIPMPNPAVRSLNLSSSVAIILFEALRKTAKLSDRS